jgi:hypothetical protein
MTDVMLTGGARLVETSVAAAGILALLYTGTPDDRAHEHLQGFRSILERDLAPAVGANTAAQMVEVFVAAVMNEKRRLEAAAGPNAPMVSQ